MKKGFMSCILITLLGIALIFISVSELMLGFAGESAYAVITSVMREGGERAEAVPGRYLYNISYTFTLPDGKEINGFTKYIGDSVYLKIDGTSTAQVRYFPASPYINAMEQDTGLGARQVILIIAGGILIFLMNRKKDRHD